MTYDITTPDGKTYHNANPSGNLVWNNFIISNNQADVPNNIPDQPGDKADYYHPGLLPAGIYRAHINGMDMHNLNAWRFNNYLVGVCADGTPCGQILFPYNLGDTVWNDVNGNGIQDAGEPVLAGVTINLLDTNNQIIKTTTTDANGHYYFNVDNGSYYVQVVPPTGFSFTKPFAGTDTSADSNFDPKTGVSDAVVISGANDLTIDAGLYQPVTIGDKVWDDANGNGIQDAGEAGLSGVTVNLLGADGSTVVATTTTATDGSYSFTTAPGTYSVQVVSPSGYTFSQKNAGSDTSLDSNANLATGISDALTLTPGSTDNSIDFGLYKPVTIGDTVWNDLNGNGVQDTNEPGLQDVNVKLIGSDGSSVVASTSTDANGKYSFSAAPGTYTVQFSSPSGYTFTKQYASSDTSADSNANVNTGSSDAITLAEGASDTSIDAGLYQPVAIGDFVWADLNGNGVQDTNEPGLQGVGVKLIGSDGTSVVASTSTDASGKYSFSAAPGTYTVQFTAPSGYSFTKQYASSDTTADSNADATSGLSAAITLASGGSDNTIDAGLYQPVTIGDFVWTDLNGNGIQDANEPGLQGVSVKLIGSDGTSVVASTSTDASGKYSFSAAPGTYTVQFTAPSGYSFTKQYASSDTSADSNADATSGLSAPITLASGGSDSTIDAGLYQPVTIGDYIWNDLNGNGVQDANEPGLQGVSVKLLASDGSTVVASTSTDANGKYSFSTVPGTYTVQFNAPDGFSFTKQYASSDTTADSNADATSGLSAPITLASGGSDNTIDAGLYQPVTIGDYVWNDLNGNGIQDSDEPGVKAVSVSLLSGNTVVATTSTDANGLYSFSTVPGTYTVQFTAPSGYVFTGQSTGGSTPANDSNANPTSGLTSSVTLASGGSDNTIDAGLQQTYTLGDTVWNDLNGNGIQESGEPGIQGVTVKLLASNGRTVLGTTSTDANGKYSFTVTTGTYIIQFIAPSGDVFTTKNAAGTTSALDSNANSNGITDSTSITASDNTIDAGLYLPASIGDFVWNDLNGNGIQDAGEPGIQGVSVNLFNAAGDQIATTSTDANGNYTFSNLAPGTYSVQFVTPNGFTTTKYLQGGATDQDSNANPDNAGKSAQFTLTSGQNDSNWDAGYYMPASIGDFVWNDANANGIQDDGISSGISGVTINLINADNTQVGSTVSGTNGAYSFTNLVPGSYTVQFVAPLGYSFTRTGQGTSATDSNPDASGTAAVTVISGQTDNSIDAGLIAPNTPTPTATNTLTATPTATFTVTPSPTATFTVTPSPTATFTVTPSPTATFTVTPSPTATFTVTPSPTATFTVTPSPTATFTVTPSPTATFTVTPSPTATYTATATKTAIPSSTATYTPTATNTTVPSSTATYTATATKTAIPSPTATYTATATNTFTPSPTATKTVTPSPTATKTVTPSPTATKTVTPSPTATITVTPSPTATFTVTPSPTATFTATPSPTPATYQIGDFVWNDINGNGIQDTGEAGIAGVTVKLLSSDGSTVLSTTSTNSSGKYSFTVTPGTYYVQFVTPSGYVYTQYLQGTNTALDSNANPANSGKSAAITVVAGQSDNTWDAGLVAASCTTGTGTWSFNTVVGLLGNSKTYTVNGLTITAYGYTSPSTATALYGKNDAGDEHGLGIASDGDHEIDTNHYIQLDLGQLQAAGVLNAQIRVGSMQSGEPAAVYGSNTQGSLGALVGTLATTLDDTPVNIPGFPTYRYYSVKANAATPANVTLESISFNCTPNTYTIGDTVWNDANGNGIQDSSETGIASVTVNLLGSDGKTVIASTKTDSNGKYSFTEPAGTYYVQVVLPTGYTFTTKNAPYSTTANDSNINTGTSLSDAINLVASDLTIDAGLKAKVVQSNFTIGDFVWNDANGNGIQDSGETGISGVTVTLLASDGTTTVASTTTDGNGNYSFVTAAGSYYIKFSLPSGYNFSTKNAPGSTTSNDSNVNPASGQTDAITVSGNDNTIDAGLKPTVNYCAAIRTPGFWKNYSNHMSDATFLSLIQATQDFNYLTISQAVTILGTNNGTTNLGISALDGTNATYLKFLLTSEINAVWNGQDNAAALGGIYGSGTFTGTGLTVNVLLHQAYTDRKSCSSNENNWVVYLGSGGEGLSASACSIQP